MVRTANIMACPLGAKSGRATAPTAQQAPPPMSTIQHTTVLIILFLPYKERYELQQDNAITLRTFHAARRRWVGFSQ